MLSACLLFAGLSAAADSDLREDLRAQYPYSLTITGEGASMRLLDLDGRTIPTSEALLLLGLTDAAAQYSAHKRSRAATSAGFWIVGGSLIVGAAIGMVADATPDGLQLSDTLLPVAGAGLIGTGIAIKFGDPKRRMGAWTNPLTVAVAMEDYNADRGNGVVSETLLAEREALFNSRRFYIDRNGRVVDALQRQVGMKEFTGRVGDEVVGAAYEKVRRADRTTWISVMGVGGGVVVIGGVTMMLGVVEFIYGGGTHTLSTGGVVTLVGIGGAGAGLIGFSASKAAHGDPRYWYDESELRQRLDSYDRTLRNELAMPQGSAWKIEVRPLIGPGMAGVIGTF